MHGIHCIQSGCFGPCCIKSIAFNHAAWNPLHSIGMHFTMLHGLHCNQSHCIEFTTFSRDDLGHAPYNAQHSIGMISPRCMDSTACNQDPSRHNAWNPLNSMTLHGIHCNQSGCFGPWCIKSTACNHAAWNPLHSIGFHCFTLHGIHCIQSRCMESTAFNQDAF